MSRVWNRSCRRKAPPCVSRCTLYKPVMRDEPLKLTSTILMVVQPPDETDGIVADVIKVLCEDVVPLIVTNRNLVTHLGDGGFDA